MVATPKRVTRRKSSVQYNEQDLSEPSDDDHDSGATSPPPRKRVRNKAGVSGPKGRRKGKAKQTSRLLEVSLDVMFEVSGVSWRRRVHGSHDL